MRRIVFLLLFAIAGACCVGILLAEENLVPWLGVAAGLAWLALEWMSEADYQRSKRQ